MQGTSIDTADWAMIEAQLPRNWRRLARTQGLIHDDFPDYMGTKVTDISQPLRLAMYHVGTNTSLKTTTAIGAAANIVDISPPALHKWMRRLGPYVATLLTAMTKTDEAFSAKVWAGYEIHAIDASALTRPGADGTTARVHYALRLSDLHPVHLEVTDVKGGETYRRFTLGPNQLGMGDRGYANPPGIAHVCSGGGDVLVRHNRGSLPLFDVDGDLIDVAAKLAKLRKPRVVREWAAWVRAEGAEPIRGRLCAVRLPPDKAEEARVRLRKEQGSQLSKESLAAADFVVLFTTVPLTRLSTERIFELYSLRWQVELHIKRDKSIAGLDRLPNFRPDTIYTWICTKLLITQIARRIATPDVAFPPGV